MGEQKPELDAVVEEFLQEARRLMGYRYGENKPYFWTQITEEGHVRICGYGSARSDRDDMIQRAQRDGVRIHSCDIVRNPQPREERDLDYLPELIVGPE